MKKGIHPNYTDVTVTCACHTQHQMRSTRGKDFSVDICAACHPFFTGKGMKIVDTAGRVERFQRKYGLKITKEA
jgi:large subunit ribosomal protein L31